MELNEVKELEFSFDYLKRCGRKLFAYGTGNGCEKLIRLMEKKGIALEGIFASDDFSRGQTFCGYKVRSLSELKATGEEFTAVLAFGTDIPQVMERIDELDDSYEVIAPDMALFSEECFEKEYLLENFAKVKKAYELLADDFSKDTFVNLTAFKITGRLEYLRRIFCGRDECMSLFDFGDNEVFCDFGAYNGDTAEEFLTAVEGRYKKIYAVEPDKRNFQKLCRKHSGLNNISFINAAAWSCDGLLAFSGGGGRQGRLDGTGEKYISARCLDSIIGENECTYVKYDVEGADIPALEGSVKTVKRCKPKILQSVYHHPYDYFEIPLYIHNIEKDYKFCLRQMKYYPAWDTELVCVSG